MEFEKQYRKDPSMISRKTHSEVILVPVRRNVGVRQEKIDGLE